MALQELNCWSFRHLTLLIDLSHLVFPVEEQLLRKGTLIFFSSS